MRRLMLRMSQTQLGDALGVREVSYVKGQHALALKDQKLQ